VSAFRNGLLPLAALALLALVLGGSTVTGSENPAPALEAPRLEMRASEAAPDFDLEKLKRSKRAQRIPDLFEPRSFAPPPLAALAPKAAPGAPPLPFAYLGRIVDGDKTTLFVIRDGEYYVISGPEAIDRQYRVAEVDPNAITFVYLPSGTRQVLPLPGLN
jgi:hypothetical protein